jgi:hypothetical protein
MHNLGLIKDADMGFFDLNIHRAVVTGTGFVKYRLWLEKQWQRRQRPNLRSPYQELFNYVDNNNLSEPD